MLSPEQLSQNYAKSSANTAGSSSAPATSDWVDNLSKQATPSSFMDQLTGKAPIPQDQLNAQGAPLAAAVVHGVGQMIQHPIEASKGAVKNIAGAGVALDSGIQNIGKAISTPIANAVGVQAPTGINFQPAQEATQYSNDAQSAGGMASNFIPTGEAVKGAKVVSEAVAPYVTKAVDAATPIVQGAKDLATPVMQGAKDMANGAVGKVANKVLPKANDINTTIDAVNPELTGKKLSAAYQQVVKGDRTVTPSGMFSEQALSPSERAMAVGTRLHNGGTLSDGTEFMPVQLTKDPLKNLPILKTALTDTESKLQTALNSVPHINADKGTLINSLNSAIKNAPNEFRIGSNKTVTKNVFDFAQKVADQADDSINGLREARTAFDNQARLQYPTAFKDGMIDTKTPAGNAIKVARDIFNDHLYNTAPNGSDIQKLVGHEADILQATEPVAVKAAKGEGKSKLQKVEEAVKKHPIVAGVSAGLGAYEASKIIP